MARKFKKPTPYYGPQYGSRGDARTPLPQTYDDFGNRPRPTGVYKGGKAKTVLRDPADGARDRARKRPTRS